MGLERRPNRLIGERSPYLLQHAYNPVDWYPWTDEAFSRARSEQKPIFLSIGYSTCHWCHVMERESFEDESIAMIMNELFVNIKVDREERPDIDRVYMTALHAMNQGGGWPMSLFLTPELKPFYGGTYFPPESRYGRIGFPELLRRIHEVWTREREKVIESASGITTFLERSRATRQLDVPPDILDECFRQASMQFDARHGGFGQAPKFPRPSVFDFLLRYFARTGNRDALTMSASTMRQMVSGGMYDHVGGGFHRYSVDAEWRIPHFEKMLYDQAQLVCSCADLFQSTNDGFFLDVIRDVMTYVLRDLRSPEGGFYCAEDADSEIPGRPQEHGEGAFYVWAFREIQDVLGKQNAGVFSHHYGVKPEGNVDVDPHHEFDRLNVLYVAHTAEETAAQFGIPSGEVESLLREARGLLFERRSKQRRRPLLDDKILTSWNGLMIRACASAYQVTGDSEYLRSAEKAASFVLDSLRQRASGNLLRRYRDGEAGLEAHLDDYAFLVEGLLDLYESSFDIRWLQSAIRVTRRQIEIFWDEKDGGFFETSGTDPSVLARLKEQYDGAEPAGNSVAAMNLQRLAHFTGDRDYTDKAEWILKSNALLLREQPFVLPRMAAALAFFHSKPVQIIIVGRVDDGQTQELLNEVRKVFLPNKVVMVVDPDRRADMKGILPFVADFVQVDGRPTAYVCEDYACKLPTIEAQTLREILAVAAAHQ